MSRDFLLKMMPRHAVVAEIGVWEGDFAARLLETEPKKLHLIDPWRYEAGETYRDAWYGGVHGGNQAEMDQRYGRVTNRFAKAIETGQVQVCRTTSRAAAALFPDGYFDWVYIDGNHLYRYVIEDLKAYYPKVRLGGCLAGDDYDVEGWWQGGVTRAVDEFITSRTVQVACLQDGQYVLKRVDPAARAQVPDGERG